LFPIIGTAKVVFFVEIRAFWKKRQERGGRRQSIYKKKRKNFDLGSGNSSKVSDGMWAVIFEDSMCCWMRVKRKRPSD